VAEVDVTDGTITVTYGRDANARIDGSTLALQPFVNPNGDVVWLCGNATAPSAGNPDPGGGASPAGTTNLLDKHMPASCRTGFGGA
jgi:type IV pilus assembly protein PilA